MYKPETVTRAKEVTELYLSSKKTMRELADELDITHATVCKYIGIVRKMDPEIDRRVREALRYHDNMKALRGGMGSKRYFEQRKTQ